MKKLIPVMLLVSVVFVFASCAKTQKDHGDNQEPGVATGTEVTEVTTAAETAAAYNAEEIVDIYLSAYSVWSKDQRLNLEKYEHCYQFLDLDFDGIPELVVSAGNIMRGSNINNYYHLDFESKKVVAYEVVDEKQGFQQSSLASDVKLVYNDTAKRKEYRSTCQPWSRYHSYNIIKSITLKDGKVYDQSIYGDGTEVDKNYENPKQIYYRFDSNFESIPLTKEEFELFVQADETACKDLHIKFTRIDGKSFDTLSDTEKKEKLLSAFLSFSYDGFSPDYARDSKKEDLSFADMPANYVFTSGAGAWRTVLSIKTDGSFDGVFSDSEAAAKEIYFSTFEGQFGKPTKINEYSFVMPIEKLIVTNDLGKVPSVDGYKYIPSDPYGLENAKEMIIYLPGTPLSEIPENCVEWLQRLGHADGTTIPNNLYVLYNAVEGDAFVGTK